MDPIPLLFSLPVTPEIIAEILIAGILLIASALISGAEVAFFSLSPADLARIRNQQNHTSRLIIQLINTPRQLLAIILVTNNFFNIGIVILSSFITFQMLEPQTDPVIAFLVEVILVTLTLVVFGEMLPKVYATKNTAGVARIMAYPIYVFGKIFAPVIWLLVRSTDILDRLFKKKEYEVSAEKLSHAIDITSGKETPEKEKSILKGIVNFGNIDVKQVMKSRPDVIAFDFSMKFRDLLASALDAGHSRIPVYKENLDRVVGVLYIKDFLPYMEKDNSFNWQSLLRQAYFVPESKKINDLLKEFQEKKIHMAVVVDEYGQTSGIVTMEDILEEIVGEMNDEFDDEDLFYSKINSHNYVFEGKTLLNDICRVISIDRKIFDNIKGETDTLAGMLLELSGRIPEKGEIITFGELKFTVESADKRRVKRVKVTLPEKKEEEAKE